MSGKLILDDLSLSLFNNYSCNFEGCSSIQLIDYNTSIVVDQIDKGDKWHILTDGGVTLNIN